MELEKKNNDSCKKQALHQFGRDAAVELHAGNRESS